MLFTCLFIWLLNLMGYDLVAAPPSPPASTIWGWYGETAAGFGTLNDAAKMADVRRHAARPPRDLSDVDPLFTRVLAF
ncbi:hypothetical protein M8494_15750 [Serratia ureilytica]